MRPLRVPSANVGQRSEWQGGEKHPDAGGTHRPNYSSLEGYIDARVFVEGLRRGHGTSRDNIIAGLESIQHVDFDGFNLNFGRDHTASHFVELSMLTGDGGVRR